MTTESPRLQLATMPSMNGHNGDMGTERSNQAFLKMTPMKVHNETATTTDVKTSEQTEQQDFRAMYINGHNGTAPHTNINSIKQEEQQLYKSPPANGFKAFPSGATRLRRLLEETRDLIVCPGVYDGFSARIALSVGFQALYMV